MQNTQGNSSRKMLCKYLMRIKIIARNIRWISVERRALSIGDWQNWPRLKQYEHFRVATLWGLFTPVKWTRKRRKKKSFLQFVADFHFLFTNLPKTTGLEKQTARGKKLFYLNWIRLIICWHFLVNFQNSLFCLFQLTPTNKLQAGKTFRHRWGWWSGRFAYKM